VVLGLIVRASSPFCSRSIERSWATSEPLGEQGLPVDIEPKHPTMRHRVTAFAAGWRGVGKVLAEVDT
jgi:hypothetical protein